MRVRVFSEMLSTGRCWMFVVFEPGCPDGIRGAGVRLSWTEALHAGCALLRLFTSQMATLGEGS